MKTPLYKTRTSIALFATLCIILTSCTSSFDYKLNETVTEGVGIGELKLGMTTREIIQILGYEYTLTKPNDFSEHINYDRGNILFEFITEDPIKPIISIGIKSNYKGVTTKGLNISKQLTVAEVVQVYGIPKWVSLYANKLTIIGHVMHYDCGIDFYIDYQEAFSDDKNLNDSLKTNKFNHFNIHSFYIVPAVN
jgi:hypothetical protein